MFGFLIDFNLRVIGTKMALSASARFTGDKNPAVNIDAQVREERFWLASGGETKNEGTKLGEAMRIANEGMKPPADLPQAP